MEGAGGLVVAGGLRLVRRSDRDGYDVFRPLVSGGLSLPHDSRRLKQLKAAFSGLECGARVRLVRRSGWHHDLFVLPHVTIGRPAGERLLFEGRTNVARYGQAGTLSDWIEHVARPAASNSRLIFALSVAFAGPIADLLDDEGGGVHLKAGSSLGKSTAVVLAGSVYGGGGRIGFAQTWHNTGNMLEGVAKAHSGTAGLLDEVYIVRPHAPGLGWKLQSLREPQHAAGHVITRAQCSQRDSVRSG